MSEFIGKPEARGAESVFMLTSSAGGGFAVTKFFMTFDFNFRNA